MAENPKKVVEAFAAAGAAVGKVRLRELTTSTYVILKQLDSPLARDRKGSKRSASLTDMDIVRLVFALTHPARESFELLSAGVASFDAAAIEFCDSIPPSDFPELGRQIMALLLKSVSTAGAGASAQKKTGSQASPSKAPDAAGSSV